MMNIQYDVDLKPFNTFTLPAKADAFVKLENSRDLPELCRLQCFSRDTVLFLGGGSNVLLQGDYAGLVVLMANKGVSEIKRADGKVWLQAQAGEVWHDFVLHTIDLGLSGLENLSLIPGTVGASPVQNIGAYGVEVKDVIDSVECFDLENQQFITLSNADCQFAYRESLFKQAGKGRYVICAVVFVLSENFTLQAAYGDLAQTLQAICGERKPTAKDVSDAVCSLRSQKLPDPKVLGNVGSFFKNPVISAQQADDLQQVYPNMPRYPQADGSVKVAAGWLIDQCGLKGFAMGGAAVHEKQALVLVNKNQASAGDVKALAQHIQNAVQTRFGIALEAEPNWLPAKGASHD
ncbi:MAG: UDP-N-acetylmuramate dehydrogenase [Neisseria sp.]|nr:UDP-N-acetylmuramate dehydrogenase [Neisseria sp.]